MSLSLNAWHYEEAQHSWADSVCLSLQVRASSSYQPPVCPSHGSALTTWGRSSESTSRRRHCRTGSSGLYPYLWECGFDSRINDLVCRNIIILCSYSDLYLVVVGCSVDWWLKTLEEWQILFFFPPTCLASNQNFCWFKRNNIFIHAKHLINLKCTPSGQTEWVTNVKVFWKKEKKKKKNTDINPWFFFAWLPNPLVLPWPCQAR